MSNMLVRSPARFFRAPTLQFGAKSHWTSSNRCLTTTAPAAGDSLPLAGIKVLDMTRVLAGVRLNTGCASKFLLTMNQPYCTQILGDLGYAMGNRTDQQSEVGNSKIATNLVVGRMS